MVNTKFTFPYQLHEMLEDAERQGFDTVVSWIPSSADGGSSKAAVVPTMFKVHDVLKFENEIMPTYFPTMTRYKSFLRQLNIYGYTRNVSPTCATSISLNDRGAYYHPLMVRYNTSLCSQMVRTKIKQGGSSTKQANKAIKNSMTKNATKSCSSNSSSSHNNEIKKNVIESNPLHSMILKSSSSSSSTQPSTLMELYDDEKYCYSSNDCYNVVPIDTTSSCDESSGDGLLTTESLKNQIKMLLNQLEQVQQVQQQVQQQQVVKQVPQQQQQQQLQQLDDCEWFASDECDISLEMADNIIAILGN